MRYLTALALSFVAILAPSPGHQLRAGMELVYRSDAGRQPPWVVDSIRMDQPGLPGATCSAVWLRRGSASTGGGERYCLLQDTLFRWNGRGARWDVARPVGPSMLWQTIQPNGDSVTYETAGEGQELIGGRSIDIVETTVTTVDGNGRRKARLRERYAVSLLTATGGVFESPDSTMPGAWGGQRSFELVELRSPSQRD